MNFPLCRFSTRPGVPVPEPYGVGENAILMEYIGNEQLAAPTLQ